jgi:hypothetical protein
MVLDAHARLARGRRPQQQQPPPLSPSPQHVLAYLAQMPPAPPLPAAYGNGGAGTKGCMPRGVLVYRGRCIAEPGVSIVGPRWPDRYWIK